MAYAIGHISGCHLNPAVSVGLWLGGRFPAAKLAPYVVAQVLGAIAAGGILFLIASGKAGFDASAGFASNGFADHSPGGYSMLSALVTEVVMTPEGVGTKALIVGRFVKGMMVEQIERVGHGQAFQPQVGARLRGREAIVGKRSVAGGDQHPTASSAVAFAFGPTGPGPRRVQDDAQLLDGHPRVFAQDGLEVVEDD